MPLWLGQLLEDPALGLQLVAGKTGLSERGPVRWAHISEIPDPTPWLEGGEILLTTGLGVRDSPLLQRALITQLDRRGCAGVGFGLGVWLDEVPDAMLEEADARSLPLFTVPYEVPFIAVTKRVSHAMAADHYATLRTAVDLHRQVLASVIAGTGVKGVIETIAHPMHEFACVVFDYYGQELATHVGRAVTAPVYPRLLWQVVAPQCERRDRFEFARGTTVVTGSVVRVGDEVEAVLILIGTRPLAEHERLLMEQGLAGLSLEFARGLSVREERRARVSEMLERVAAGRTTRDATGRELKRLGFWPAEEFHVLSVRRPSRVPERALCALAEDARGAYREPIVGRWNGSVCCIVQPADAPDAARIAATARSRGWSGVVVGRSRAARGPEGLGVALREATVAASAPDPPPDGVQDVTGLGLTGILAGIDDDLAAETFIRQVLGTLLDQATLLETLRVYLRHGCRPGAAAAELCIHRHTLAYRLDRIRDLTDRDPRDGAHLLEYGLALELHTRHPDL
ncbi:MAG: PucR family transcriptional regulator [Egibacteraceae bacterium]